MGYSLYDLQVLTRISGRNALDPSWYSYRSVDFAILQALKEWARLTKTTGQLSQIALAVGNNAVPSLPSGMKTEYITRAYLSISGQTITPDLQFADYQDVLRNDASTYWWCYPSQQSQPIPTGQPTMLGFQTPTTAFVDTLPDQAYTLNLWWWGKPPSWTAGQAFITPTVAGGVITSLTINIPGSIYTTNPTITISDATGNGATIGNVSCNLGGIVSVQLTAGGTGYTAPVVNINGVPATLPVFTGFEDDALEAVASLGAPYFLQKFEPANASAAMASYQAFIMAAKQFAGRGAGQINGRVLQMRDPRGC